MKYWYVLQHHWTLKTYWVRTETKGHILYDFIFMKFLDKFRDIKQIGGCWGWGREENRTWSCVWGFFLAWWKYSGIRDQMVAQQWECTISYWIVCFKMVKMVDFICILLPKKLIKMDIGNLLKKISSWPINIWQSIQPAKLQIKPQSSITTHLPGCLNIRRLTITSVAEDMKNRNSFRVWWNCKLENCCIVSTEAEQMHIIWCSNFTPSRKESCFHQKKCAWMLIAVLTMIANNWKQPKWSSLGKWKNKLC